MKEDNFSNGHAKRIALISAILSFIVLLSMVFILSFVNTKKLSVFFQFDVSSINDITIKDSQGEFNEVHLSTDKYAPFINELNEEEVSQYIFSSQQDDSTYYVSIQIGERKYILNESFIVVDNQKIKLKFNDSGLYRIIKSYI